jgi:hypothetical protein
MMKDKSLKKSALASKNRLSSFSSMMSVAVACSEECAIDSLNADQILLALIDVGLTRCMENHIWGAQRHPATN